MAHPRVLVVGGGIAGIQAALGATPAPAGDFPGYGHPDVVTSVQFERLLSATGPQGGKLVRPSDHTEPSRLAFIQCVGSREPDHPYCSRLCCSQALKNALLLKERYPLMGITILYRDLRAYGFREAYYVKAKDQGVTFIPFEAARPPRVTATRRRPLTVWVEDALLKQEVALPADLVVLSTGIEPAVGSEPLARQLRVAQTLDGWFYEAHQKLKPVDSATEGVFLCGVAHYPKSLGETPPRPRPRRFGPPGFCSRRNCWPAKWWP